MHTHGPCCLFDWCTLTTHLYISTKKMLSTRGRSGSSTPVTWSRSLRSAPPMLRAALLLCSCALARGSNAVGEKFLAENKNKEGVITLASGMQYKVLRTGDGESRTTARPNTPSTARPNRASP